MPLQQDKKEWKQFINKLWTYNILDADTQQIPSEIEDALYFYSQGIIDILLRLFILSQKAAIIRSARDNLQRLTVDDIETAFNDGFNRVRPMIEALRSRDPGKLDQFDDMNDIDGLHEDWEEVSLAYSRRLAELDEDEIKPVLDQRMEKILGMAKMMFDEEQKELTPLIQEQICALVKENPKATIAGLIKRIIPMIQLQEIQTAAAESAATKGTNAAKTEVETPKSADPKELF